MDTAFCLGVVGAEPSGDKLGGGVVETLKARFPDLRLKGIGGPELQAQGLQSLCDIHDLSVMGVEDLLRKLPGALAARRQLYRDLIADPPDVFLGIDSPDFNLGLEARLRKAGIPVAHLVSPTVWAWRGYRVSKIRRSVDRMLVLFPFEKEFYRQRGVAATFVGHPAAAETATLTVETARRDLGIDTTKRLVAVLPGSRESEIRHLAQTFSRTIKCLSQRQPDLEFLLPFASERIREQFVEIVGPSALGPRVRVLNGQARTALAASDVALIASGTAALEAALVACPMVVAYRVSTFTFQIARALATTRYVSMPNHLMPQPLIPEFLQGDADEIRLCDALERLLNEASYRHGMKAALGHIRQELNLDTNRLVVDALVQMAGR